MRTNGSWKYDKEAVEDLDLQPQFDMWFEKTKNEDLAFTIVMFRFLKEHRKESEQELKLVYTKVIKRLKAELQKVDVDFSAVVS